MQARLSVVRIIEFVIKLVLEYTSNHIFTENRSRTGTLKQSSNDLSFLYTKAQNREFLKVNVQ